VDLLECLKCELRVTVADTGVAQWTCPDCKEPLELVAIGLQGTPEEVSTALNARYLLSRSHPPGGESLR